MAQGTRRASADQHPGIRGMGRGPGVRSASASTEQVVTFDTSRGRVALFQRSVERADGCWNWTGAVFHWGHGQFYDPNHRRSVGAHRYAYALQNGGMVPRGMVVMHACDNPRCVNPAHLVLGTASDNSLDRHRKGRSATGQANGRAKLSAAVVEEIRARYKCRDPEWGVKALAKRHNVSSRTISNALHNRYWVG